MCFRCLVPEVVALPAPCCKPQSIVLCLIILLVTADAGNEGGDGDGDGTLSLYLNYSQSSVGRDLCS